MALNPLTPKRGSLRNKALGAAALGILAVGIWIGTLFQGLGLGRGGNLAGQPDQSGADTAVSDAAHAGGESVDLGNVSAHGPTSATASTGAPPTITVMIYGDSFRLLRDPLAEVRSLPSPVSSHFAEASLEEVVAQARHATGNENGIKVLIVRNPTATVGARGRLLKALHDAGFQDGELHQLTDFYP